MSTSDIMSSDTSNRKQKDCAKCPEETCQNVEIMLKRRNPDELSLWGLDIVVFSCDSSSEYRILFKFSKKQMLFNFAAKFIQRVWKCSKQEVKITILTLSPLPIEFYHFVVQTFQSGRPMTRGHFLWLEQEKCFDFSQILNGADLIYTGTLFSKFNSKHPIRNYFHLKNGVEDPRVLSLAFTACIPPCKCVYSEFHFTFRWEFTN